jgi:HK97 family phage major capsid protein
MAVISKRNFTFKKFIASDDLVVEGMENEVSRHGGRCVPWDLILTRDMSMGVYAQGGATVGTQVQSDIVPFLRAKIICGRLGATIVAGLQMPNAFPVFESDFSSSFLAENQAATSADVSIGAMTFSPHRVSATINIATMLIGQAAGDFEDIVRREMTKKLFQSLDAAALTSPTSGAAPLGLLATANTNSITFGGAPTWGKVMSMPQAVENSNSNIEGASLGFACSPNSKYIWRTTQRGSGTSTYICEGDRVGNYPVEVTTELNSANAGDRAIFGNFADLYLGIFGQGIWVNIDPYSLSKTGEKVLTCHLYGDAGTPRPQSFCVSSDSAAA